jgi:hypothetical protein
LSESFFPQFCAPHLTNRPCVQIVMTKGVDLIVIQDGIAYRVKLPTDPGGAA